MHRCPWCGAPCPCDEFEEQNRDCVHDCGADDGPEEPDEDE